MCWSAIKNLLTQYSAPPNANEKVNFLPEVINPQRNELNWTDRISTREVMASCVSLCLSVNSITKNYWYVWVWGLLQPGFVRWAPPPASHDHFNHWAWRRLALSECLYFECWLQVKLKLSEDGSGLGAAVVAAAAHHAKTAAEAESAAAPPPDAGKKKRQIWSSDVRTPARAEIIVATSTSRPISAVHTDPKIKLPEPFQPSIAKFPSTLLRQTMKWYKLRNRLNLKK